MRFSFTHLRGTCPSIHAAQLTVLSTATETVTRDPRLALTELRRVFQSAGLIKHSIKRMCRLLGNWRLPTERSAIYTMTIRWLMAKVTHPAVLADRSGLTPDHQWHVLRASLAVGGGARTIYGNVHPNV